VVSRHNSKNMDSRVKLPVDEFSEEIIKSVQQNPVTVVVAETGAGKSTRIPFLLMEALGKKVIVTQPRRLAAESVAARVAAENGLTLGELVGFRTAVSSKDSVRSRCMYVTDGLQLVRELAESSHSVQKGLVLIIDEVHEFNENIETLLAWCDQLIRAGADCKIVIMSATLEHESLSLYFNQAPVIHVPGKTFPVLGSPTSTGAINQQREEALMDETLSSLSFKKNTLVFFAGKSEIFDFHQKLDLLNLNVEILDLHGDLTPEEQSRVFASYERPKLILSTNIAQTSLTISDIDCIIDTGYEKRIELWNGVETLMKRSISKADVRQRAGRAGRTKRGNYVLCHNKQYQNLSDFPIPEILRKRTDQLVLRLAAAGFDAPSLRFYHPPDSAVLSESKQVLIDMEALAADGTVTELGRQINAFPTSIIIARMILESIKRRCLGNVLTIAAILSTTRSSIKLQPKKYRTYPPSYRCWDEIISPTEQYQSDLFVELELWDIGYKSFKLWAENGVDEKAYLDAVTLRKDFKDIVYRLGYGAYDLYNESRNDEGRIRKCIAAGMIHYVHRCTDENNYSGHGMRKLSKDSVVNRAGYPPRVVGDVINIAISGKHGDSNYVIPILSQCTVIEPSWLLELAPRLVKIEIKPVAWNYEKLGLTIETITYFRDKEVNRTTELAEWSEEAVLVLADSVSKLFLPDDAKSTAWIDSLRAQYFERGYGQEYNFAADFAGAIKSYKTLLVDELEVYKDSIAKSVLVNTD
jgi:HrpA-like RNA helicase